MSEDLLAESLLREALGDPFSRGGILLERSLKGLTCGEIGNRNDYCPCGSEKKYKNCCWDKDHPEV